MFHSPYASYGTPAGTAQHLAQPTPQAGPSSFGGHFGQQPTPIFSQHQQQHNAGYAQQAQHGFSQPMMSPLSNPDAFVHMFKGQLASLTFNSKPIITNLTVIAHENVAQMAAIVAQCLDEHIVTAPPAYRLPALYALDSICKNVGSPYTELWSERITAIFMETYRVVDHAVKGRMEELLNTWRHSGPHQSPLFGPNAQQAIERLIWGSNGPPANINAAAAARQQQLPPHMHALNGGTLEGRSPYQSVNAMNNPFGGNVYAATGSSDVHGMLNRFDQLLNLSAHHKQNAPHLYDATRAEALTKLRSIVASAALSANELSQIAEQLASLESEMQQRSASHSQPQYVGSPQHALNNVDTNIYNNNGYRATPPLQQQQHFPANAMRSPMYQSSGATVAPAIPASLAGALAHLSKARGSATPPNHRSTPPPPLLNGQQQQQRPNAALDLVASLRQAGLLPSSATAPLVAEQDTGYCQMIKGMELKLSTADLHRDVPLGSLDAINVQHLPLQCRQCANRYPAGPQGQASLDRHLDWHFRQTRRAKESAVRGQSRSWFTTLIHWIRGGHDDVAPAKLSSEGGEENGAVGVALTPAQEAELKSATKKFVVAPSDDPEAAIRPCPICKELFKSEWSEDEEEWVWKNCVKVGDTYYHASCHYSAKKLSHVRTAVKSMASGQGSRESTPQADLGKGSIAHDVRVKEEPQADKADANESVALVAAKSNSSSATQASAPTGLLGVKRKSESSHDVKQEGDCEDAPSSSNDEGNTPPAAKRVAVA